MIRNIMLKLIDMKKAMYVLTVQTNQLIRNKN